jgi:hypothetical protein
MSLRRTRRPRRSTNSGTSPHAVRSTSRAWVDIQAEREGELQLRAQTTANLAHRACFVVGLILVSLGVASNLGLLSSGQLASGVYCCTGLGLLRWVAGGMVSNGRESR